MKSLPLAYNRDLQEDKEPLFDTVNTVKICLAVFNGMIKTAKFKRVTPEKLQSEGFLTATDIADYLVLKGIPFRDAHEITGKTVAYCLQSKKNLTELSLPEFKKISAKFKEDVLDHISIESSLQRKASYGGTARKNVTEQIARLQKILKKP